MENFLTLPTGSLAEACATLARTAETSPMFDHSVRSFLYARLLAESEGTVADPDYDEDLLFAACVLHDLGLGAQATGQARFEVESADLAAALLSECGVAPVDVDRVWEAIALHASLGIADRMGLLTYLTHRGVMIEVGRDNGLPLEHLQAVGQAYPGPTDDAYLRDAIADHAARSEAAAPPGSLGLEFLRQRRSLLSA